ncbi:unnamed protein product [Lampetra fluviatilis]
MNPRLRIAPSVTKHPLLYELCQPLTWAIRKQRSTPHSPARQLINLKLRKFLQLLGFTDSTAIPLRRGHEKRCTDRLESHRETGRGRA